MRNLKSGLNVRSEVLKESAVDESFMMESSLCESMNRCDSEKVLFINRSLIIE